MGGGPLRYGFCGPHIDFLSVALRAAPPRPVYGPAATDSAETPSSVLQPPLPGLAGRGGRGFCLSSLVWPFKCLLYNPPPRTLHHPPVNSNCSTNNSECSALERRTKSTFLFLPFDHCDIGRGNTSGSLLRLRRPDGTLPELAAPGPRAPAAPSAVRAALKRLTLKRKERQSDAGGEGPRFPSDHQTSSRNWKLI